VNSLAEFLEAVRLISAYQAATHTRFVWRGVANADWPLHSSLVRAYIAKHGTIPTERDLRRLEGEVLAEARAWALDWHPSGGRLRGLELLAALQHFSVPTRMLDFTVSPLIALWFAVEQQEHDAGRVFAIEISERMVSTEDAGADDPWWLAQRVDATSPWSTESWIWRPPPIEPRMVRQASVFLMGGVPSTNPARAVNRPVAGWRLMRASEIRECMSVPFGLINYQQAVAAARGERLPGATPKARAFTLRIEDKQTICEELERGFGYSHSVMFPDFPGLARFGTSFR
jgi:hypothetical protein